MHITNLDKSGNAFFAHYLKFTVSVGKTPVIAQILIMSSMDHQCLAKKFLYKLAII